MVYQVSENAKFRRMPRLGEHDDMPIIGEQADKQARCDDHPGHILKLAAGKIICTLCDAEWKDEGF